MSKKNTNQKLANKKNDKELRSLVEAFLKAFSNATAQTEDDASRIFKSANFSFFSGAMVELTSDVTINLAKLALRMATLLGAKRGHEKALRDIAMKQAQESFLNNANLETAATALIDRLFEEGNAQFRLLATNYLIMFEEGVRSIEIGPVRAMLTEEFAAELSQTPNARLQVFADKGFSFTPTAAKCSIYMHPLCWLVSVDATEDNVDEEATWLIDIALSFLRLHYTKTRALFPDVGTVESHPLRRPDIYTAGVRISEKKFSFGGGSLPAAYQIDQVIKSVTSTPKFLKKTELIFAPPDKSLAERFAQGLGWLTRGRQAKDRAERLLYFFTAIESLLSSDDKTAPVVQNIARHASVILTNDNDQRAAASADLKKLYAFRSAIVHAGSRSVLWNNADTTQYFAEAMFSRVLDVADLASPHSTFLEALSRASYGSPWPVNSSAKTEQN